MKKTLLLLIFILLFGCKSKIVTVNTHSSDTIRIERIVKITPEQINSLIIDSPCDSLGNLKPFTYKFNSGKNTIYLKGENNIIYLKQNIDSIKQVWQKEQQKSTFKSDKMEIISKTPKENWIIMLVMSIIIVLLWKFR